MASVRLQLTQDVYMPLDGQWQIVLSGTVFDTTAQHNFSSAHVKSVAEVANSVTAPTSVRSVRTK